jgi:hypothetical protein
MNLTIRRRSILTDFSKLYITATIHKYLRESIIHLKIILWSEAYYNNDYIII